jgi:hypothetical protein
LGRETEVGRRCLKKKEKEEWAGELIGPGEMVGCGERMGRGIGRFVVFFFSKSFLTHLFNTF